METIISQTEPMNMYCITKEGPFSLWWTEFKTTGNGWSDVRTKVEYGVRRNNEPVPITL